MPKVAPGWADYAHGWATVNAALMTSVQDAFGPIWGIPTTFLISRDGKICRKNTGIQGRAKYERDIKALL